MNYMESTNEIISKLPNGTNIDLSAIEGWHRLLPEQHTYITHYVASVMQHTSARIASGISKREFESWSKDTDFHDVLEDIEALFTEGLAAVDYKESLTNSKIRGRVLASREAKGYTKDKTPNNHLHVHGEGGLHNLLKALN